MADPNRERDSDLVRRCVAGSEKAWNEFYSRFVGLVRNVVKRRLAHMGPDTEDVAQKAFIDLVSALKSYDATYSLPRFVAMITERACIEEYRSGQAAKRQGRAESLDETDESGREIKQHPSPAPSQEERLARAQDTDALRTALRRLGEPCGELLRRRYFEELSYREISQALGGSENTLTVQARRCLEQLGGFYREVLRKGMRR